MKNYIIVAANNENLQAIIDNQTAAFNLKQGSTNYVPKYNLANDQVLLQVYDESDLTTYASDILSSGDESLLDGLVRAEWENDII